MNRLNRRLLAPLLTAAAAGAALLALTACGQSTHASGAPAGGPGSATPLSGVSTASTPPGASTASTPPATSAVPTPPPTSGVATSPLSSAQLTALVNRAPEAALSACKNGLVIDHTVAAPLAGDGTDTVVSVTCDHATAGSPEVVEVFSPQGKQLATLPPSQPTPATPVSRFTVSGSTVTIYTVGYQPNDSLCCGSLHYKQTFSFNGPNLSSAPRLADVQACTGTQLAVSFGPRAGAAGTASVIVRFKNTAPEACTLQGYPGLDATNASGGVLAHAARETGAASATVTLAPGASASALVLWQNTGTVSAGIALTPPNTTASATYPTPVGATHLRVRPVQPGLNG